MFAKFIVLYKVLLIHPLNRLQHITPC